MPFNGLTFLYSLDMENSSSNDRSKLFDKNEWILDESSSDDDDGLLPLGSYIKKYLGEVSMFELVCCFTIFLNLNVYTRVFCKCKDRT